MKRICVSACLLGVPCRWKGDSRPCEEALRLAAAGAEVVPFCPEEAAGLGCPRPPIELVRGAEGIRALRVDRTADATDALRAACGAKADELARSGGADAFLLKLRSPSCGLAAPLHDPGGREIGAAPGVWAAIARARFPGARFLEEAAAGILLEERQAGSAQVARKASTSLREGTDGAAPGRVTAIAAAAEARRSASSSEAPRETAAR